MKQILNIGVAITLALAFQASAQTVAPQYATHYPLQSLGAAPGVPTPYGGVTISPSNRNLMLIGGAANTPAGAVYAISISRSNCGDITGFVGSATLLSTAPHIDGGLVFANNGVLLTTRSTDNAINMIKPGSTTPDKVVSLSPLGVAASTGSIGFVSNDFFGGGKFKILSYNASRMYNAVLTPDASGTFDISNVTQTAVLQGGPNGIASVPRTSPLFSAPAMLVAENDSGAITAWDVDQHGDAIANSRRPFVTGVSGARGAYLDPTSGNFIFATSGGGDQIFVMQGFPEVVECDLVDFNRNGVFPEDQDLIDFFDVLAGAPCPTDSCNDVDFNNNCIFPEDQDIIDFLNTLSAPCPL
jgi:hypothetical protein